MCKTKVGIKGFTRLVDKEASTIGLDENIMQRAVDGDVEAQLILATLFELGVERPQDLEQAKKWFQAAAKQGHSWAQLKLAQYFGEGKGTKKNEFAASEFLNKANDQGLDQYESKIAAFHANKQKSLGSVLLVMDEGERTTFFVKQLELCKFKTEVLSVVDKAFTKIAQSPELGLIILDLETQNKKGEGLFNAFKTIGVNVPTLVICGKSKLADVKSKNNESVIGYLVKPVTDNDFSNRIDEITSMLFGVGA